MGYTAKERNMKKIHLMLMGMLVLVAFTAVSCNGSAKVGADTDNDTDDTADISADVSATTETAKTVTIEYRDAGFSPANVTINKGDTVRFLNKSSNAFWPASGPHPTHTALPAFDAKQNVAVDGNYDYTFNDEGEWGYHNHLKATAFGKVTVN